MTDDRAAILKAKGPLSAPFPTITFGHLSVHATIMAASTHADAAKP